MNEQLRQRAQEIATEHGNDAYSVALAMLEREQYIESMLGGEPHSCDDEPCGGGNADSYTVRLSCGCFEVRYKNFHVGGGRVCEHHQFQVGDGFVEPSEPVYYVDSAWGGGGGEPSTSSSAEGLVCKQVYGERVCKTPSEWRTKND